MVTDNAITVNGVTFGYNGIRVFTDLSLTIPAVTTTALIGPNGCGKTSLLELIAGVVKPQRGTITCHAEVALAVQRSQAADTLPITVTEAVAMGRWRSLGLLRRPAPADREIVAHWITEFGLAALAHRRIGELSGGQRQRVLLAQTFAQQAPIMLLDEPTNALDDDTSSRLAHQLHRLSASGTTIVVATHDHGLANQLAHCVQLGGEVRTPTAI